MKNVTILGVVVVICAAAVLAESDFSIDTACFKLKHNARNNGVTRQVLSTLVSNNYLL